MEWHAHSGLVVSFVEMPRHLEQDWSISSLPQSHIQACQVSALPLPVANDEASTALLPEETTLESSEGR